MIRLPRLAIGTLSALVALGGAGTGFALASRSAGPGSLQLADAASATTSPASATTSPASAAPSTLAAGEAPTTTAAATATTAASPDLAPVDPAPSTTAAPTTTAVPPSPATTAAPDVRVVSAGDAGSITVVIVGHSLELRSVDPADGWTADVENLEADEVEVRFTNQGREVELEVKLEDGELRVKLEDKADDDDDHHGDDGDHHGSDEAQRSEDS